MTRLPVRLMLLVVCIGAMSYAAYQTWSSERQARLIESSAHRFDATARATTVGVAELRAAQQAYVAAGQGEDFWFARVSAIVKDINDRIGSMKSAATAPGATTALDDATGALQDFEQMDKRARDYARGRQVTLASDLVFTDGFDLTRKAADAIERSVTAELTSQDAAVGVAQGRRSRARGRGAGRSAGPRAAVAGRARERVLQGRRPGRAGSPDRETGRHSAEAQGSAQAQGYGSRQRRSGSRRFPGRGLTQARPCRASRRSRRHGFIVRRSRARRRHRHCPRCSSAAAIIEASGIVPWIADPDGRELAPILVHGVSPQLATRLGNIRRDAANVTASAYRTGLLQTVKGDGISSGALAAPLVTAGGCVGVMAAELKNSGEQEDSLLAAATIIASQLATLVGPPSTRAKAEVG
jgi:hypothetical protein